jgi:hypothetical protein
MIEIPMPRSGCIVEELDDELCLYRPDSDEVLVLNGTAADTWRLIDGSTDIDEIASMLARSYSTNIEIVRTDVVTVLQQLTEHGYLESTSA